MNQQLDYLRVHLQVHPILRKSLCVSALRARAFGYRIGSEIGHIRVLDENTARVRYPINFVSLQKYYFIRGL